MVSCPRLMSCFGAGRGDELLGQGGGLAGGDHPADRVPAVDVEDHVEVVVGPFRRAVQLGDVPGPDLVRAGRHQLGLDGRGMEWPGRAARGSRPVCAQQPVEGGHRAQVGALVQQDRPRLGRGGVSEPLAVQHVQDRAPLGRAQRARLHPVAVRHRSGPRRGRAGPVPPVPAGLRHAGRLAGRPGADPRCHGRDGLVGHGVGLGLGVRALGDRLQA